MRHVQRILQHGLFLVIAALLVACGQPVIRSSMTIVEQDSARPGFDIVYLPKQQLNTGHDVNYVQLAEAINRSYCYVAEQHGNYCLSYSNAVVDEQQITIKGRHEGAPFIYKHTLANLLDYRIAVNVTHGSSDSPYIVFMPDKSQLYFKEPANAQNLADRLFLIQQILRSDGENQDALFRKQAAQYRDVQTKPRVSEEQRKYIVQANTFSQRKEYGPAIALYKKAVQIEPVAYPEAYFNMSLLYAQEGHYWHAITNMKKYLLLVPDARDSRSAQDKIYEWEALMQK
jgi:tetratricopeptide (TPR) repeat protein